MADKKVKKDQKKPEPGDGADKPVTEPAGGRPIKATAGNSRSKKTRNWRMIDSILFAFIILLITTMMVFAALVDKEVPAEMDFQRTDEYSYQVLNTFTTGTFASVNYTDYGDSETVYAGWTARRLIIEDVRIRENLRPYKAPANTAELENGIENAIQNRMDMLVGDDHTFVLTAKWTSRSGENGGDERSFEIKGRDHTKVVHGDRPVSVSDLEIQTFDPDGTEIGEFQIVLTLKIYEI